MQFSSNYFSIVVIYERELFITLVFTRRLSKSLLIVGPVSVESFCSVETFLNDGSRVVTFDVDRSIRRYANLTKSARRTWIPELAAVFEF